MLGAARIRRPVSRVLCRLGLSPETRRPFLWTARRRAVLATYPDAWASDGPARSILTLSGRGVPIRSCSRRGLPCRPGRPVRGGLLPHPFTLTAHSGGGLLSVALSLGSPPAGVTRRLVAVEPGLSSPRTSRVRRATARPSDPPRGWAPHHRASSRRRSGPNSDASRNHSPRAHLRAQIRAARAERRTAHCLA